MSDERRPLPSVEESLQRIKDIDARLHSVVAVDPDASAESERLEGERRQGRPRGPLHGLGVLIKDNIDTAGPIPTTAGSALMADNLAAKDAPVVTALRAAGAVILGKTNLSEWANFRSTHAASGWSGLGGLTANPYSLDRSAGGSSSGSAAAVAAGFAAAALGTETDGSILCPAALCGCVGLKPTVGLTSRTGVIPISDTQDSVGPMTATVRLAAALLDAMTGGSHLDSIGAGVGGLRLGLPRRIGWGLRPQVDLVCQAAVDTLGHSGVTIVEEVALSLPETLDDDEITLLVHEFRAGINAYLAAHPQAGPRSLSDLIDGNFTHRSELAHFGQEIFLAAEETSGLDAPRYLQARERCRRAGREEGIDAALDGAGVDALAVPTQLAAWKSDLVNGDPDGSYSSARLPAVAGYPALTVPVGLVGGLPIGLTIFGTARSEAVLLRLGAALEDALGTLPPPQFKEPAAG